jgi:hypothetical protein
MWQYSTFVKKKEILVYANLLSVTQFRTCWFTFYTAFSKELVYFIFSPGLIYTSPQHDH